MRRGPKPGKAKLKARPSIARRSLKNADSRVRNLEKRLAEALEQQTATAEILRVISSSATDIQPVLDTVAECAARLCAAQDASIFRRDGDRLLLISHHGPIDFGPVGEASLPLVRGTANGRSVLDRRTIHVADLQAEVDEFPEGSETAQRFGHRTVLNVPLMRDGVAIGSISIRRTEVHLFTDQQIGLLQTFADQAVIAIENVRLFNETKEALEQQTATSEILRVITTSPTDLEPVLNTVVVSAARFCGAHDAVLFQPEAGRLRAVAHHGPIPLRLGGRHSVEITPGTVRGRAFLERRTIHVADLQAETGEFPAGSAYARERGHRTILSVPLLREGAAIGVIHLRRTKVDPFTDKQIALLQTFADQAVIAIENVRLFKELEARNRDLTEGLERETATGEILRVIAASPTDTQPVLEAILDSGKRLCNATFGAVFRFEGDAFILAASTMISSEFATWLRGHPLRPGPGTPLTRAGIDRRPVQVADILADPDFAPPDIYRREGMRTALAVPMLKDDVLLGALTFHRHTVQPFTDQQVALLETFAAQAVIAIENVRLFNETKEALEQQTATAEILRVISSSPTDVQPVFDAIVQSASRLCEAEFSAVVRFEDGLLHLAGTSKVSSAEIGAYQSLFPRPPRRDFIMGRAFLDGRPVHVEDVLLDPDYDPHRLEVLQRAATFRTYLGIPIVRNGIPIGAIGCGRHEMRPFTDAQVELVKTFADQAVIAVENVRLFKELEARTAELTQSVEQLTALGEVSRAVSSTLDVETVLDTIVSRATQLAGADGCAISEYDDATELFHVRATHGIDAAVVGTLRAMPLHKGEGTMGRAGETREPTQIADIAVPGAYQSHVRDMLIDAGYRALLSVPLLREEEFIGSLSLTRKSPGEYPSEVIEVLKTFATQSALAIQNARLFREIADKSAQLEAASRHKSEFLANMSHELRTPLNAIIGFSEVLVDRMFGELTEKQDEYLKDIYASGQHLLSLINDILDLSKIEAGRMELEVTDFDLPSAIDNALILVRERASRRGITLGHSVDERLGHIRGDERKVKQVLLNLLSNALKFTPEGGRIDVSAGVNNGVAEIAVADTGVGIAPEDQEAVFEEFRQVGTADKKVEGTGLGLALSRKFIELHGGRIWVQSQVGHGSTFTFTLPVRREE